LFISYTLCTFAYNRETLVKLSNVMKLFDKIESHPLVREFYEDSDGYWASLVDGYTLQGATQVHEETLTEVWASLKDVCTMEEWETRWNAE
jgi:hypothetical protein